ncbi:unnamed protein product [Nippostrongylus brasiliensis]|uniref:Uncharacterized protein n=1 Tax=Nippostrongylus brasiliensis TaxID=27835 RepID=A0A0N4XE47_NIPBR|nr:unnamed protein product [Nippostrongylus brasiliensis]
MIRYITFATCSLIITFSQARHLRKIDENASLKEEVYNEVLELLETADGMEALQLDVRMHREFVEPRRKGISANLRDNAQRCQRNAIHFNRLSPEVKIELEKYFPETVKTLNYQLEVLRNADQEDAEIDA